MQRYIDTVLDRNGNVVQGASVAVTTSGGAAATIYSDNGITPISSLVTGSDGSFSFYAANGRYTITVTYGQGVAARSDVTLFDPADSGAVDSSKVSFTQAGAGAVTTTAQDQLRGFAVRPENYGATGDGTTDDSSALQKALDTGKLVFLAPAKTYAFGSQLTPPSNGGFVGGGTLKMLTSAGKFDASAYGAAYAANVTGVLVSGAVNTRIEARFDMEANAGIRVCHPLAVRNSTNVTVIGEAANFKEMQHGALSWDSNVGGYVRWYAHDMTPNSTTLGSMQVTGFTVDDNRIGGVNSTGLIFDVTAKNLRLGASARVTYGEQSDGVNIRSQGYSGFVGRIYAEEVGEGLDCYGDNNNIQVAVKNAYMYGVKLIHGAAHNEITATVDGTAGDALVYGASTKSAEHNHVRLTASRVGELTGGTAFANPSAVHADGPSATYKPQYNRTEVVAKGNGTAMKYVVFDESGSYNTYDADGIGWATQFGSIASTAGAGNIIRRKRGTFIRAYMGTATTVSNNTIVPYDTVQSDPTTEYDAVAGRATVRCEGRFRCYAAVRAPGIAASAEFGLMIFKNGAEIARSVPKNPGAGGTIIFAAVETVVECDPGDILDFRCNTTIAGSVSVTNSSQSTYMYIEQI